MREYGGLVEVSVVRSEKWFMLKCILKVDHLRFLDGLIKVVYGIKRRELFLFLCGVTD